MSGRKQITIRLTTLILIVIAIIVAIVAIVKVTKKDNKVEENNKIEQKNENREEKPNTNVDSTTDFEISFLKIENEKQNMLYSPLSIKYALNMLNEGAQGETKEQIDKIIGNLEVTKYDNVDDALSLANGLYIRNSYSDYILDDYIETLEDRYNAEVRYDTFKSARNINGWISDKTLGQIENMLDDEQIKNPDNKMVLINALAIDMEWANKFDEKDTSGRDFYLEDGSSMKATMMYKETKRDTEAYYKDENVTALAMELDEYDDTTLEFIAIMPKDNLSKYIEKVTMEDINNIIDNMKLASDKKAGVNILIPRFSFDYDLSLRKDLEKLGITDAFNSSLADFSGITDREGFCVGEALHKANIDFTEKGIKAAAVTVIMMKENAAIMNDDEQPEIVKIDNPFMYLIRDKETGEIWFVGTVYEPNSWEDDRADYQYR